MIYLNDDIYALDLERALEAVSPQRRALALRYRFELDRRLSLAVYLLLCEGLKKEYGITEPPEFVFGPHGKPALKDHPGIHFNLSHCHRAALCVLDDAPVGCDVECVPDRLDRDICRRCFNEEEIAAIQDSDHPTMAFTRLWTRKEAFLKLTGEGLTDQLPVLFSSSRADNVCFRTYTAADRSYVYTVCRWNGANPLQVLQ